MNFIYGDLLTSSEGLEQIWKANGDMQRTGSTDGICRKDKCIHVRKSPDPDRGSDVRVFYSNSTLLYVNINNHNEHAYTFVHKATSAKNN